MEKENQIYSSTGELGVSRRQFGRLYVNGTRFAENFDEVAFNFRRLAGIGGHHEKISRVVYRGIVSDEVMHNLLRSEFYQDLEVTLPLSEYGHPGAHFMYLARNRPERAQIETTERMIEETTRSEIVMRDPGERVYELQEQGYTFPHTIANYHVPQLTELWGNTFGWQWSEVEALQGRLGPPLMRPAGQPVWFSGVERDGQLLSAAMAERIQLPGPNGKIDFVESTEWVTRSGYERQGLMTANLAMLTGQILHNYMRARQTPIVYAECNFQSRSDLAGYGAGFRVPNRIIGDRIVPQILIQNVGVNDGQDIPKGKLRDFNFMRFPYAFIHEYYSAMGKPE